MPTFTSVESSLSALNAAKLDAFFFALRANEADPLVLAIEVPEPLSCQPRATRRSLTAVFPAVLYLAELDPRRVWRRLSGKFRSGHFFSEAEARERALHGPGLPHHRHHPLTADEALAGIVLALVCLSAVIYLVARCVA
jgi:hypothetical protein